MRKRSPHTSLIILSCLAMLSASLTGCGPQNPDCASPEIYCVGLVTEIGPVEDQGPNQAAWTDLQRARDEGLVDRVDYIETVNTKDYPANIRAFVEAGYDLVVTIGYGAGKATLSGAEEYPRTQFIGFDQPLPEPPPSEATPTTTSASGEKPTPTITPTPSPKSLIPANLTLVVYPEDQAGFLAGALAAMMTQTKIVGAVCESEGIQTVKLYCEGFKVGVEHANPAVSALVKYREGSLEKTYADPEWGNATASDLINAGADVIFAIGGQTAEGALRAAAEDQVYAIGAEIDQYYAVPEVRDVLLSSAIKKISPTLYEVLTTKLKAPSKPLPVFVGQVGYAPAHKTTIPPNVANQMDILEQEFAQGTLETGVDLGSPSK